MLKSIIRLTKSGWKSADPKERIRAVKELKDQRTIGKLASEDPDKQVRVTCVR